VCDRRRCADRPNSLPRRAVGAVVHRDVQLHIRRLVGEVGAFRARGTGADTALVVVAASGAYRTTVRGIVELGVRRSVAIVSEESRSSTETPHERVRTFREDTSHRPLLLRASCTSLRDRLCSESNPLRRCIGRSGNECSSQTLRYDDTASELAIRLARARAGSRTQRCICPRCSWNR
jgi:hypothetical protein